MPIAFWHTYQKFHILTWKSAVAEEITRIETGLERKRRKKAKGLFKRLFRSWRDAVLG